MIISYLFLFFFKKLNFGLLVWTICVTHKLFDIGGSESIIWSLPSSNTLVIGSLISSRGRKKFQWPQHFSFSWPPNFQFRATPNFFTFSGPKFSILSVSTKSSEISKKILGQTWYLSSGLILWHEYFHQLLAFKILFEFSF